MFKPNGLPKSIQVDAQREFRDLTPIQRKIQNSQSANYRGSQSKITMYAATKKREYSIGEIANAVYTQKAHSSSDYMRFLESDTIMKNYWTAHIRQNPRKVEIMVQPAMDHFKVLEHYKTKEIEPPSENDNTFSEAPAQMTSAQVEYHVNLENFAQNPSHFDSDTDEQKEDTKALDSANQQK